MKVPFKDEMSSFAHGAQIRKAVQIQFLKRYQSMRATFIAPMA
jgi:hypothetical protein